MFINKFIKKSILFITIFLLLNLVLSEIYFLLVLSKSDTVINDQNFRETVPTINILVLGDSHARNDVHTGLMPNSYIFASYGENFIQTYYKLEYYLNRNITPELILLPIDIHSFSSFRSERFSEHYYWNKYINYIELGIDKGNVLEYLGYYLEGELAYLGGLDETLEFYLDTHAENNQVRGFSSRFELYSELDEKARTDLSRGRAKRHLYNQEYFDDDLITYFLKILDLCDTHNIPVVLIRYPVTFDYYSQASELFSIEALYTQLTDILIERDKNPTVLDYHDTYWGQDYLFADSDHLNVTGAEQFTILLMEGMEALGLLP